jgi:hypothetical protein
MEAANRVNTVEDLQGFAHPYSIGSLIMLYISKNPGMQSNVYSLTGKAGELIPLELYIVTLSACLVLNL